MKWPRYFRSKVKWGHENGRKPCFHVCAYDLGVPHPKRIRMVRGFMKNICPYYAKMKFSWNDRSKVKMRSWGMTKSLQPTLISMYTIHQRSQKLTLGHNCNTSEICWNVFIWAQARKKKKHPRKFPLQTRFFYIFRENPLNYLQSLTVPSFVLKI